jgi:hypothetical protein
MRCSIKARLLGVAAAFGLLGWCAVGPVQAATITKSLAFDVELFPMLSWESQQPAPDRLTGSVAWSFDELDPLHTTVVSDLDLIFNGRIFTLADVGVFTAANTSIPFDEIVIGGTYDGSFPNQIGGTPNGTVTRTLRWALPMHFQRHRYWVRMRRSIKLSINPTATSTTTIHLLPSLCQPRSRSLPPALA